MLSFLFTCPPATHKTVAARLRTERSLPRRRVVVEDIGDERTTSIAAERFACYDNSPSRLVAPLVLNAPPGCGPACPQEEDRRHDACASAHFEVRRHEHAHPQLRQLAASRCSAKRSAGHRYEPAGPSSFAPLHEVDGTLRLHLPKGRVGRRRACSERSREGDGKDGLDRRSCDGF